MPATLTSRPRRFTEIAATSNARVDRAAGVIRNVKLVGLKSRNGREYLPEALRGATHLYEGRKVFVDHPRPSEMECDRSRPEMVPIWRLYATTGMRKMELVRLRFDDVDWESKSITIRASVAKGKKSRRILMDDAMVATIRELQGLAKSRPSGWNHDLVFVSQIGNPLRNNLLRKFYAVCKRAGIEDGKRGGAVDLHSLRVTFATLSLEGGASPKAVQSILGHATLDMTMRVYAKATDRSMRDAINALPFASASTPEHVIAIDMRGDSSPKLTQISHNCDSAKSIKAG